MTVREKCEKYLYDCGMWEKDAASIVVIYAAEDDDFRQRQDEPEIAYPLAMIAVWLIPLKRRAAEWTRANQPQAWWLPNLETETPVS